MSVTSNYSDLYKSRNVTASYVRQSERRTKLLKEQKQQRNKLSDEHRNIDHYIQQLGRNNFKTFTENPYRNQLQLSEWLLEKPEDIEKWFLVPCPKGKRCLVVAENGRTRAFNKYGALNREFRSRLPGDQRLRQSRTILDCIFVPETAEYFVLDVIAYAHQDMTQCETDFRFFWIRSKLEEEQLSELDDHNEAAFKSIPNYLCDDEIQLEFCLHEYPMWRDNTPALDGLLFYHKESSYVRGTTPLVGWLLPFMLPELMSSITLNPNYLKEKPSEYVDYLHFIRKFDASEAERKKQNKRRPAKHNQKMEIEWDNSPNGIDDIIDEQQSLEMETPNDSASIEVDDKDM